MTSPAFTSTTNENEIAGQTLRIRADWQDGQFDAIEEIIAPYGEVVFPEVLEEHEERLKGILRRRRSQAQTQPA